MTQLLFSPYGRLGRLAFFLWMTLMTFINAGACLVIVGVAETVQHQASLGEGVAIILMILVVLLTTWTSFALAIKRFHDMDASGWWVLLLCIPYFGILIALVICFIPGTEGANQYGDEPQRTFAVGPAPGTISAEQRA